MPWSNQSGGGGSGGGGGWKGGGPWGQGPTGGGPGKQQPDLEELLKRSQDKLKQALPGGGVPGPLMVLIAALGAAVVGFFAFAFTVAPDELGVVMRFGKYVRQEPPGLHFRLPYPVEEVRKLKYQNVNAVEVGLASSGRASRDAVKESLMLTGDENIVDLEFVVFWRIKDPKEYLFNIRFPDRTVKDVAESSMREVVGKNDIQPILTGKRRQIEDEVQKLMQTVLDGYKAGVLVTQVQMQKVDPPNEVINAFRDVQAARADQERVQNEAQKYANQVTFEARGQADKIMNESFGYKLKVVADATGQASRFLKVYDEYKKAPEVTRKRMFLETMERVMTGADKIIIDSKNGQGSGVVPYLPLNELTRPKTP